MKSLIPLMPDSIFSFILLSVSENLIARESHVSNFNSWKIDDGDLTNGQG